MLLPAVWWVWTLTAWITDLYSPQRTEIQLLVIATMLGSLVMAAAVPEAFGKLGLVFATAYVSIQIGRALFLVLALRGHALQRRSARVLFWFGVSAGPWIAGALVSGAARGLLWTLAVVVDYSAGLFRYPVPWLGRSAASEWPILAEHLAERYRQFFIIALGELILITGLALSDSAPTRPARAADHLTSHRRLASRRQGRCDARGRPVTWNHTTVGLRYEGGRCALVPLRAAQVGTSR